MATFDQALKVDGGTFCIAGLHHPSQNYIECLGFHLYPIINHLLQDTKCSCHVVGLHVAVDHCCVSNDTWRQSPLQHRGQPLRRSFRVFVFRTINDEGMKGIRVGIQAQLVHALQTCLGKIKITLLGQGTDDNVMRHFICSDAVSLHVIQQCNRLLHTAHFRKAIDDARVTSGVQCQAAALALPEPPHRAVRVLCLREGLDDPGVGDEVGLEPCLPHQAQPLLGAGWLFSLGARVDELGECPNVGLHARSDRRIEP
mmetsp:Transcript_37478/g.107562  ORF Transcript_37478/g.107562 Transcript_37478/m.107562 type:complete len:256 (-) Transcript_37478:15-782(-)